MPHSISYKLLIVRRLFCSVSILTHLHSYLLHFLYLPKSAGGATVGAAVEDSPPINQIYLINLSIEDGLNSHHSMISINDTYRKDRMSSDIFFEFPFCYIYPLPFSSHIFLWQAHLRKGLRW